MKKLIGFGGMLVLATILGTGSAYAETCQEVLSQAKEKLSVVQDDDQKEQVQNLIQEAEKAMEEGNEQACLTTAKKAITAATTAG